MVIILSEKIPCLLPLKAQITNKSWFLFSIVVEVDSAMQQENIHKCQFSYSELKQLMLNISISYFKPVLL